MKALIAFDGSEPALRAVDWVAHNGFSHATVLAVRPHQEVVEGRRRRGRRFSDRPGWAWPEEVEKAVEQLQLAGVSASSLERSGNVAKTIMATAAGGEFDLIVIGSRGRRGLLRRIFFPSIPEQVVKGSSVSVHVVRPEVGG